MSLSLLALPTAFSAYIGWPTAPGHKNCSFEPFLVPYALCAIPPDSASAAIFSLPPPTPFPSLPSLRCASHMPSCMRLVHLMHGITRTSQKNLAYCCPDSHPFHAPILLCLLGVIPIPSHGSRCSPAGADLDPIQLVSELRPHHQEQR